MAVTTTASALRNGSNSIPGRLASTTPSSGLRSIVISICRLRLQRYGAMGPWGPDTIGARVAIGKSAGFLDWIYPKWVARILAGPGSPWITSVASTVWKSISCIHGIAFFRDDVRWVVGTFAVCLARSRLFSPEAIQELSIDRTMRGGAGESASHRFRCGVVSWREFTAGREETPVSRCSGVAP